MQTITVPQVFKAMGVEPTNAQAWSAGARVATMYAEKHGQQPPKENRQKTSGSGSLRRLPAELAGAHQEGDRRAGRV